MAAEQEARERILAVARRVIRNEGVGAVTVRRIAAEAEVGLGLVNYHFGSKGELIQAASRQLLGPSTEGPRGGADTRLDAETRIRRTLREGLRSLEVDQELAAVLAEHELAAGDAEEAAHALLIPLREHLGQARSEVELRMLAFMLWSVPLVLRRRADAGGRFLGLNLAEWTGRETAMDVLARLTLGPEGGALAPGAPSDQPSPPAAGGKKGG